MDYGDVVINLMVESMRKKYNLEKIWSDCGQIEWEDLAVWQKDMTFSR